MTEFNPPKITNRRLFEPGSSPDRTVTLGAGPPDWYAYAHGYKAAADLLVAHLNDRGVVREFICLPILYLYRHQVELYLKAMLEDLDELDATLVEELPARHGLRSLWNKFRSCLDTYDPGQDSAWIDRAEVLVAELDGLDSGSLAFRYPIHKDGTATLSPVQTDMVHFKDVMDELSVVLEGGAAYLDEHLQIKRSSAEWFGDYYYP